MRHTTPLRLRKFYEGLPIPRANDTSQKAIPALGCLSWFNSLFEGETVEAAITKPERIMKFLTPIRANAAVFHPGLGGRFISFELFPL
jgi:hypothetical protein